LSGNIATDYFGNEEESKDKEHFKTSNIRTKADHHKTIKTTYQKSNFDFIITVLINRHNNTYGTPILTPKTFSENVPET